MEPSSALPSGNTGASLSPENVGTWDQSILSYDSVLDDPSDIQKALDDLTRDLSRESSLISIRLSRHTALKLDTNLGKAEWLTLNNRQLSEVLDTKDECAFELYAISRHLQKQDQPVPADHRKLQISVQSFRALAAHLNLPARFVVAIPRHFQVCGTGIQKYNHLDWEYWCLVPVRVTVGCRALDEEHAKSTAGSNQMDPFHYVHLGGAKVDIRGSHIAVYMRRDAETSKSVVVVVSLLDGRWGNVVEEPLARIQEKLARVGQAGNFQEPLFVLLIYLSFILRWWNNVLWCFHKQLIIHLSSKSKVIRNFCDELGRKVQNILTLLFNQIQATNDRTLQAILIAAQEDTGVSRQVAVESHELSRSMKKDSIAMKTIAIMTMAFLPATSFAALLSMPFFNNDYMLDPARIWIWFLLTLPTTVLAFYIFWRIAKRKSREYLVSEAPNVLPKLVTGETIPLTEV